MLGAVDDESVVFVGGDGDGAAPVDDDGGREGAAAAAAERLSPLGVLLLPRSSAAASAASALRLNGAPSQLTTPRDVHRTLIAAALGAEAAAAPAAEGADLAAAPLPRAGRACVEVGIAAADCPCEQSSLR